MNMFTVLRMIYEILKIDKYSIYKEAQLIITYGPTSTRSHTHSKC